VSAALKGRVSCEGPSLSTKLSPMRCHGRDSTRAVFGNLLSLAPHYSSLGAPVKWKASRNTAGYSCQSDCDGRLFAGLFRLSPENSGF